MDSSLFERALQDKINYELVVQSVNQNELGIKEEDIQKHIQQILSKSPGWDLEAMKTWLKQQGKSFEQYKNDIKAQMTLARWRGREIHSKAMKNITLQDIKRRYQDQEKISPTSEKLIMRQIFSKSDSVVKNAFKELKKGTLFKDVQEKYSDTLAGQSKESFFKSQSYIRASLHSDLQKPLSDPLPKSFTPVIKSPIGIISFILMT